ncbi:MAG TPA: T9SS type A sorting domain-containing protein [Flavipsychrobacter sp.]|nr:T9SS type A sorting domain-containing protein [Flavipsychrobacter sp.]
MFNSLPKIITTTFLSFVFMNANAQDEYFASANNTTGGISNISKLPDVWAPLLSSNTFDQINERYFFIGIGSSSYYHLYTIDATDGNILYDEPLTTLNSGDALTNLQYDKATGNIYAIHWKVNLNEEVFASIDPANGTITDIKALPDLVYVQPCYATINSTNHTYIFRGQDNSDLRLYTINIATGDILFSPIMENINPSDSLMDIKYDAELKQFFGLHWDDLKGNQNIISIDPKTGIYIVVMSLSGVKEITESNTTYDITHHYLIFNGTDHIGSSRLYTIEVDTAKEIFNPLFPVLPSTAENMLALEYCNGLDNLFGLHWGTATTGISNIVKSKAAAFPNPYQNSTSIQLDKTYSAINVSLYNALGQQVQTENYHNNSVLTLKRNDLPAGVYFANITADNKQLEPLSLIIK